MATETCKDMIAPQIAILAACVFILLRRCPVSEKQEIDDLVALLVQYASQSRKQEFNYQFPQYRKGSSRCRAGAFPLPSDRLEERTRDDLLAVEYVAFPFWARYLALVAL